MTRQKKASGLTAVEALLQLAREEARESERHAPTPPPVAPKPRAGRRPRAGQVAGSPTERVVLSEDEETKSINWGKVIKTCPKCGRRGPVDPMFGTRPRRGVISPQSWCSHCRANTDYRRLPRKNRSRYHDPRR